MDRSETYSGKLLLLAYPDTFVRFSEERILKMLSWGLGIGKDQYIKAGHAAFVLIENQSGSAAYFDFGRYITPNGYGRVRSAQTDAELTLPMRAKISNFGTIENLSDFLIWLASNPDKTHGYGRLVATVCDYIHHEKVKMYALHLQAQGSIPYRAFGKKGSNCSRFVTNAILAGTDQKQIRRYLLKNKLISPITLGNVKGSALKNPIYQVIGDSITYYSKSIWKESISNFFDKKIPSSCVSDHESLPNTLNHADLLSGVGSSAYFALQGIVDTYYEIIRYNAHGEENFRGCFEIKKGSFDLKKSYEFVYDSNCQYCHVMQEGQKIRFDLVHQLE